MQPFEKANKCNKEIICENTYNEYIKEGADFIYSCESAAKIISAYVPAGCYTNFRDALFHFYKMVSSMEMNEIERQRFAVSEHINRARTDAMVSLIDEYQKIICYMRKKYDFEQEIDKSLKDKMNMLCSHEIMIRLSGMMIDDFSQMKLSDDIFFEMIRDLYILFRDKVAKEFNQVIEEIRNTEKNIVE